MTSYRVGLDGAPVVDMDQSLLVRIWDLGPDVPELPVKPKLPEGEEGSPKYDLALIDFKGELASYETELKAYGKAQKDFAEWHKKYGGPYEFETHSVNAREALQNDPERYAAELPKGRKAGKFHLEEKQRQAEMKRSFAQTVARDPVFGTQGAAL